MSPSTFTALIICLYATTFNCYSATHTLPSPNVQRDSQKKIDYVEAPNLKSVKFHRLGWELSDPVIELNGNDKLLLSFDDTGENFGNYSYSITHCDASWNPSNLFLQDYLNGFETNEITSYTHSSGTIKSYLHFRLELPNNEVSFRISGNYVIQIFSTYEPDRVLISKRFAIYEPIADIKAAVRQPAAGENRNSGQQLEITVSTGQLRVSNPAGEVKLVACKNYPFQNCLEQQKPDFIRGSELIYSHTSGFIFEGGNEFRIFDIRNLRYQGQGIKAIDYYGGMFNVLLRTDESRRRSKYTSYSDFNGKYIVSREHSHTPHVEADYCWVYFTFKPPMVADEGWDIYLYGEFTNWQLSPGNRLHYNFDEKTYEISLLLKQGAYNYTYLLGNSSTGEVDPEIFEGSHFGSENTYILFFYYRPLGSKYDRLVGFARINSRNPI